MSLRRAGTLVVALALSACQSVTQEAQSTDLVFASYNSATGAIPLPNDLLLQIYTAPTAAPSATVPQAQIEVLRGYAKTGGFPSDVEAAITIPFNSLHWNGTAYVAGPAPTLDPTTVRADTVVLLRWDTAGGTTTAAAPEVVAYDPVITAGRLTLRPPQASPTNPVRHWKGGRYVVAVRGGARGVKTDTGAVINADSGVALAIQNKDMNIKENQPPGFTAAQAAQVNGLRSVLWNAFEWSADDNGTWSHTDSTAVAPAFTAVNAKFPYAETATISTFSIDTSAHVALDSAAGLAPFPSDFLFSETRPETAEFPQGCPAGSPTPCLKWLGDSVGAAAAKGLQTLDGFSTSALLLAPLTGAVDATTITWDSVHVFDLSNPAAPVRLKDLSVAAGTVPGGAGAAYGTQPSQFNRAVTVAPGVTKTLTTTLALAPAAFKDLGPAGKVAMPPLKEKTQYVVVVTNRVKNVDGSPLTRGAAANVILSTAAATPLYAIVGGAPVALVSGLDGPTAFGLQTLRNRLTPLLTALPLLTANANPAKVTTRDDVVMIYTVKTQSVTGIANSLAAAPYQIEAGAAQAVFAATALPTALTPPAGTDLTGVAGFFSVPFNSLDVTDKARGTLRPTLLTDLANPLPLLTSLHAYVALPNPGTVTLPDCPAPSTNKCAKVVFVGHGLGGDKDTVFELASQLTQQGFIVAGIDFPLHGERNWCKADADCSTDGVTPDGTCDKSGAFASSAGQGDCGSNAPASAACQAARPGVCAAGSTPLKAGSRFLLSTNFFRARDTFRQYTLDMAAAELALSRPAGSPQPAPVNAFAAALAGSGLEVDTSGIYHLGLSWGSIDGTIVVATHPRVTRASFSVGGATVVDALSTSPTYRPGLDLLLPGLITGYTPDKVDPAKPEFDEAIAAKYVQVLALAKWILDPGDPVNYAGHISDGAKTLPDLLANPAGTVLQQPKQVFAQIAKGDTSVPNDTNYLLDLLIGGPITLYTNDAGGNAPHDMIKLNAQVAIDAALYLVDPVANVPPETRALVFP